MVLLLTLLLPSASFAEAGPDYGRPGAYGIFSMAVGAEVDWQDTAESLLGDQARVDTAIGFNVRAGYRVLSRLALEAEFEWLPGFDVKVGNDVKAADLTSWRAGGNVKGYLIDRGRFQPFLNVGLGYYRTAGRGWRVVGDFSARFGGGFDGYFTENIAISLSADYILNTGSVDEFDYVSVGVGVMYRF
jgi:hypothetical protein